MWVTASDVGKGGTQPTNVKLIDPNSFAASARSRVTTLQDQSTVKRVREPLGRVPETETEARDKAPETEVEATEVLETNAGASQGRTAERADDLVSTGLGEHRLLLPQG